MYLEMNGIGKSYGESVILSDVTLSIDKGKSLAIIAPSGAGKSTLLSVAGLLLSPDTGTLRIDGQDVSTLGDDGRSRLRGRKIGFLFQHTQLVGTLRAWENVAVAADFSHGKVGGGGREGRGKVVEEAVKRDAIALLESLGLADRVHHFPHQLSVGQKRRIATARALFADPDLIIADEPTNDLDGENAQRVVDALFARVKDGKSALLLATHDMAVAARADAQYHLT